MRNRLNNKNFGILITGIIIFTRLDFYQNFKEMVLTGVTVRQCFHWPFL